MAEDLPFPLPLPLITLNEGLKAGRSSSELENSGDALLGGSSSESLLTMILHRFMSLGLQRRAGGSSSGWDTTGWGACSAAGLAGLEVEGCAGAGAVLFGPPLYLLPDKQRLK